MGCSLKRTHCKRHLVPSRKQVAHQLSRTQGSLFSLKRVLRPLHTQDSTCSNGQHYSGVIHKQRRRHEVGPTLCSTMENLVSPVPDPLATAVDALSLPWEDLGTYAFPPAAILGKVVEKLQDFPCKRIILIAPGRPNMPWFWDLMAMSSQIPRSLPNLLTQPFNQIPHRNLTSLNLHTWLLEPQQS